MPTPLRTLCDESAHHERRRCSFSPTPLLNLRGRGAQFRATYSRHTDALAATLTDAQKELLDKLIAAQTEQSSLGECDAFIRGFVIGVKIIQEVNSAKV